MSVKHSLLFMSLAALALGGTATAQDRAQTFRDRDVNNDGVLTQSEYGGHPGNFRSLDVNGDGVLSYDEFVNRGGRPGEDQNAGNVGFADPFAVMDRNNDGVISSWEWNSDRATFRRLDVNGDGLLSRREYSEEPVLTSDNPWQRFRALDRNGDNRLSRREAGMSSAEFRRADYDNDGALTISEYRNVVAYTPGSDQFVAMDRNNDGVLSRGEWRGDRETFDRLDRNNDRVVTRAEYRNASVTYSGSGAEEFRALDRNGNGVLSRGEAGMSNSEFDRADRNDDGVLTLKEYMDRNPYQRVGGFFGSILGNDEQRFRDLDLNNDGILRPNEWQGSMTEFELKDLNNDGVITLGEYLR